MKYQFDTVNPSAGTTLQQLVKHVASSAMPLALRRNSFIINDVPRELAIMTNENLLVTVICSLLYTVINHSENSCIRIEAREYEDIVFVELKSNHFFDCHAIAGDLQKARFFARDLYGNITFEPGQEQMNKIMFSFPNLYTSSKHEMLKELQLTNLLQNDLVQSYRVA